MRWRVGVDEIRESSPAGARGVGTVTHCVHGRSTIAQEIVDWLPPHHYTFRERNPAGECVWTLAVAPRKDEPVRTWNGVSRSPAAACRRRAGP